MQPEEQILSSIFPNASVDTLRHALSATGNSPERAAEFLLTQSSEREVDSAQEGSHSTPKQSPARNKQKPKAKLKPYSRLQSGVGQGVASSPRQRRSPSAGPPQLSRGDSPATSFASVVTRNNSTSPAPYNSQSGAPAFHEQARQLSRMHPWAGGAVLQNVLEASERNTAVAGAWLADMEPFIHGELETAHIAMYADEAATPPGPAGAHPAAASSAAAGPAEAVYWDHRAEAVKLTREWRRLFRRSVAVSRAGDDSEGRFLMVQAHAARARAHAAHEAAAGKIEAAMNREQGRSLWELDLHGLHAPEAVAALQRRLELVLSLPPQGRRSAKLRVITGRGLHSSAGEATVPRAVAAFLEQHSRRYGVRVTPALGAFHISLPGR